MPNSRLSACGCARAGYGVGPMDEARRNAIPELPMDAFSYVVNLGDYHPPLGGYVLLAAALAAFGVLLGRPEPTTRRWALGILSATVPLTILTNTWSFLFRGLLVAGCLVFLWAYRERPHWQELLGTGLIPCVLLYRG